MKSSSISLNLIAAAFTLASAVFTQPVAAATYSYSFACLSSNSVANCADGAGNLVMDVSDAGNNQVDFSFRNFSALGSSISEIYFDGGVLAGIDALSDSGVGVNFTTIGVNPKNLPAANNATPDFSADFAADTVKNTADGVQNLLDGGNQEFLTLRFDLAHGYTFEQTIQALDGGITDPASGGLYPALRVGLHVRSFSNGGSESFINIPTPIPEARTYAMMLVGLGLVGFMTRRPRAAA
jgi:hypothetical protein